MSFRLRWLAPFLAFAFLAAGRAAESREPKNIYLLKQELKSYVDSGHYMQDIAAVAADATKWIEQRVAAAKPGERLALILDIDETMLSNLPEIRRNDFGYVPPSWSAWVRSGQAPVIAPVREVFRAARRLGVAVLILTGRVESDRAGTEANLRAAGYDGWTQLHFKPDDAKETTGAFKAAWRRRFAAEGWTLIANLGDQETDLAGGFSERTFKLPNPFYLTK
ncbi:MAG: HAD family acid phosphatase [Opitutae bacterium]|nr:HAD family acid phosphatase [Opitutae bacterium]